MAGMKKRTIRRYLPVTRKLAKEINALDLLVKRVKKQLADLNSMELELRGANKAIAQAHRRKSEIKHGSLDLFDEQALDHATKKVGGVRKEVKK